MFCTKTKNEQYNTSFQFQDEGTQRQALPEGLVACGRQRDKATKVSGEIACDFVSAKSFWYVTVCLIAIWCHSCSCRNHPTDICN